MSALRFRPDAVKVPWQAIAGFAVIVYLVRSTLRSWDFRPDMLDAIVFGGLAIILIARPLAARWLHDDEDSDDPELPAGGAGGRREV